MRFFILFISILVLAFLAPLFLPWWAVVVAAFIGGFALAPGSMQAFLAGFTAVFLLWAGQGLWVSGENDGILAAKMGQLLGGVPGPAMPWVTGLLGAILGGLGAWCGNLGRKSFR